MACPRAGTRCQQESPALTTKQAERTDDDGDEARVGVVRNRAEERVLVHVWRGEERGARLVHDHDDLVATRTPRERNSNTVSMEYTLG